MACGGNDALEDPSIVELFRRLDEKGALASEEIDAVERFMDSYHRQTTLHCDEIWRRQSPDGLRFGGPGERVLQSASVADVVVGQDGIHTFVYNDTRPGRLVDLLRTDPSRFWAQGLVGFGGIGLSRWEGPGIREVPLNLHLENIQEAVDPDLALLDDGSWRLVWFGVEPGQMNAEQHGPLASAKPHRFYRSQSQQLGEFPTPQVAVASREGTTGGSDPTVMDLKGGGEILFVGPLDHTAMGWRSADGIVWPTEEAPSLDSRVNAATPDVVSDPAGGYRMYYMVNGSPGRFGLSRSTDGIQWGQEVIVMEDGDAFNISVAVDPQGVWWAYYNRTDSDCLSQWGSKRVLPGPP